MQNFKRTTNISISTDTHKKLVLFMEQVNGKIGNFCDNAISERIDFFQKNLNTVSVDDIIKWKNFYDDKDFPPTNQRQ